MIPVMIFDDEPAVAEILRYFIERDQLPLCVEAVGTDGREAGRMLDTEVPHLVFMDIQMPYANGLQLMERYAQHKYIVISAFEIFEYAQTALRLGAADFLTKPIRHDALMKALERAVGYRFHAHPAINAVLEVIHTRYAEPLSLAVLAEKVQLDASYLARLFRRETGMPVMQTLQDVRVKEAKRMLTGPEEYSLFQIADACGFPDTASLNRHFRRREGMSPLEYRKSRNP